MFLKIEYLQLYECLILFCEKIVAKFFLSIFVSVRI